MELNRFSIGYTGDLNMWNNIALVRGGGGVGLMNGINMTLIVEWFNIRYMGKTLCGNNMGVYGKD
jgi:hypothetical protein